MRNAIVLTMVLGACTLSLSAQKPEAFDVVSIRQSRSADGGGGSLLLPGGRYTASNVPVIVLLDAAYGIPPERVVGGPAWIRSDRYNIEARADGAVTPDDTARLVRRMLRDRFQLKARVEQRETDVFVLLAAKPGALGSGARPAAFDCTNMESAKKGLAAMSPDGIPGCGDRRAPGRYRAGGVTLESLADVLTPALGRPVLNRTNITSRFDLVLDWAPQPGTPDEVSLVTALREQLGLRLERQRVPMDTLVIEQIERPVEN